jgi:hypothetical protein
MMTVSRAAPEVDFPWPRATAESMAGLERPARLAAAMAVAREGLSDGSGPPTGLY